MFFQGLLCILIKGRRIIDGFGFADRTKAGIEMVVKVIDQLQGNDSSVHFFGDTLHGPYIAANEVAGKESVSTK